MKDENTSFISFSQYGQETKHRMDCQCSRLTIEELNKNIEREIWDKNLLVEMKKVKSSEIENIDNEIKTLMNEISRLNLEKEFLNSDLKKINNNIIEKDESMNFIELIKQKIREWKISEMDENGEVIRKG